MAFIRLNDVILNVQKILWFTIVPQQGNNPITLYCRFEKHINDLQPANELYFNFVNFQAARTQLENIRRDTGFVLSGNSLINPRKIVWVGIMPKPISSAPYPVTFRFDKNVSSNEPCELNIEFQTLYEAQAELTRIDQILRYTLQPMHT